MPRCARPARWWKSIIPTRGKYLSVGNPIKLSASPSEVKRSPLLGRAHQEVLRELGYSRRDGISRRYAGKPARTARVVKRVGGRQYRAILRLTLALSRS